MKNFKKIFAGVLLVTSAIAIIVACSDNNESNDKVTFNTKTLNAQPYQDQLAFVTQEDSIPNTDFIADNSLYSKMEDTSVDWTYFDNLYNNSLPSSLKQELSYIILCKKDLIGLVKNSPSNTSLAIALKKHVDNLVNTKYLGYTALYYALTVLQKDAAYVEHKANLILEYAAEDPFHPDMLASGPAGVGSQDLYDKFEDNYNHLSKIATLK